MQANVFGRRLGCAWRKRSSRTRTKVLFANTLPQYCSCSSFYTTPLSHSRFCKRKPQGLSLFCCAGGCLCPVICRWWCVVFPDRPDTGACGLETPPISGDVLWLETTCCTAQWWCGRLGLSERTSRRLVIVAQTGALQEGKRASACMYECIQCMVWQWCTGSAKEEAQESCLSVCLRHWTFPSSTQR